MHQCSITPNHRLKSTNAPIYMKCSDFNGATSVLSGNHMLKGLLDWCLRADYICPFPHFSVFSRFANPIFFFLKIFFYCQTNIFTDTCFTFNNGFTPWYPYRRGLLIISHSHQCTLHPPVPPVYPPILTLVALVSMDLWRSLPVTQHYYRMGNRSSTWLEGEGPTMHGKVSCCMLQSGLDQVV